METGVLVKEQTTSDVVDNSMNEPTQEETPPLIMTARAAEGNMTSSSSSSSISGTKEGNKEKKQDDCRLVKEKEEEKEEEKLVGATSNLRKKQSTSTNSPPITENSSPAEKDQSNKNKTKTSNQISSSRTNNHDETSGESVILEDDPEETATTRTHGNTEEGNGDEFDIMDCIRKRAIMEREEINLNNGESSVNVVENPHPAGASPGEQSHRHNATDEICSSSDAAGIPIPSGEENSAYDDHHQEEDTLDVMDVVRKRARMANEEFNRNNQQEELVAQHSETIPSTKAQRPAVAHHGAYAGSPGASLHRRDDIRFSLVGVQPKEGEINSNDVLFSLVGSPPNEENITDNLTRLDVLGEEAPTQPFSGLINANNKAMPSVDGLAEAMPVKDDEPRDMEAQPFDVESAQKRKEKGDKQQRKSFLMLALVFSLIVVGVIFGVHIHNDNEDSRDSLPPPTLHASQWVSLVCSIWCLGFTQR